MTDDPRRGPTLNEAELRELARALSAVLSELHILAQETAGESLAARLGDHLDADPQGLPVLSHEFPQYQLVDVQVALEAWQEAGPDRSSKVIGVAGDQRRFHPLSELLSGRPIGVGVGPVE